jgi:hypothetical protein
MPLVTITCKPGFAPTHRRGTGTARQLRTEQFGEALPELLTKKRGRLHLDKGTPPEAVQVDYKTFHPKAVNAPDIWIRIEFSEYGFKKKVREQIRTELHSRLRGWFSNRDGPLQIPAMSLDIFWGPTHGFLELDPLDESIVW